MSDAIDDQIIVCTRAQLERAIEAALGEAGEAAAVTVKGHEIFLETMYKSLAAMPRPGTRAPKST